MPYRPIALVVEDDFLQRSSIALLLEESEMDVFQCESAEAAELVLQKAGGAICFMFTDVNLAGSMTGTELAGFAASHYPNMKIVVTSGNNAPPLPGGTTFLPKPWNSLDVLREAGEACHH
jgi:two-component system, cell cycle response regulator CpdR